MAEETGANVGSAFIDVVPSAQGFSVKLAKELKKHGKVFQALGVEMGDELLDGIIKETKKRKPKVKPELDDEQVRKDYEKLKDDIEKDKATVQADADTASAEAQLQAASRNRIVDIKAKINQKSLAGVKASLAALTGGRAIKNVFEPVKDSLMNLDKSVPKIAMVTGAFALLGATALSSAGGAIALGGALASISGAGLLLPGILGGAAVGAVTFGLALSDTKKVLGDLAPQFKAFKDQISGNFWSQAETPIRNMVSTLLPQFQAQMSVTSTALGAFTGKFATAFTSAIGGVHLDKMFSGLNQGIKNAEAGIPGVTSAIQVLGVTGSSYLPRMGTWLSDISNQFGSWLKQAQQSGQLTSWIETALVNLRALGSVVASTGSILKGLFDATQAAGFGGLVTFADTLSRIATVVNGPAFQGALVQVLTGAKNAMNGLAPAVGALGDMFVNLAPVIQSGLGSLGSSVGAVLTSVFQTLGSADVASGLDSMIQGISGAFRSLAPAISSLGPVVGAVFRTIGTFAQAIFPIIGAIFTQLGPVVTQVLNAVNPLISALGSMLLPVVSGLLGGFRQFFPVIAGVAGVVGGAVLAFKAFTIATNLAKGALFLKTAVLHGVAIAQGRATLSTKANTAAQYAGIVVTKLWRGAMVAAAVAQRLFNAAMRANPIGLIITGIMLLVGALIWFFTKTKAGQKIWETVWGAIKTAVSAVVTWFQTTVVPLFQTAIAGIVAGFQWFKNIAATVWQGFMNILLGVWNWIKTNWPLLLGLLTGPIGLAVALIVMHWNKIKAAIAFVFNWFQTVLVPMFQVALASLGNFFKGLYTNYVKPVFTWIRTVISNALKGARLAFVAFKTGVTVIWTAFKTMLSTIWNWIRGNIFNKIKLALIALKLAFVVWKNGVASVWKSVKSTISTIWNWIKAHVFTPIKTWLVNTLKSAFNGFKNTVSTVFSKVKGFADTLWSGMKTIFGKLKDGASAVGKSFQTMKNTIKSAFEKARDTAKKPVKAIIGFVNDPLIKGINKVGNIFKLKDIPTIKMPKGFAKGGAVYGGAGSVGGYTGNGRKFEPAGVVHRGEYVVKKSATSKIERKAPGLLNSLNSGRVPGFAKGGSVGQTLSDSARWWQSKGGLITEFGAWGQRVGGHSKNSLHYSGKAYDLNFYGGTSKREQDKIDKYLPEFRSLFPDVGIIWKKKDHWNHAHFDTSGGARVGEGGGGGVDILSLVPGLSAFTDKLKNLAGGDSPFGKMISGAGTWMFDGIKSWLESKNPFAGGGGTGTVTDSSSAKAAQAAVREVAKRFGWDSGAQWNAILKLVDGESSWNPKAANPGSSARGLFQKMTSMHGAVEPTAGGQAEWGLKYIKNSYGTPVKAYQKWLSRSPHWYSGGGLVKAGRFDNGGWLPQTGSGVGLYQNASSGPERVRSIDEEMFLQRSMAMSNREYEAQRENKVQIDIQVNGATDPNATANAVADKLNFQMRKHQVGAF